MDLLDPDLVNHQGIELTPVPEVGSLYYFDYDYSSGIYIAIFYENGVPKASQAYSIRDTAQQLSQSGVDIIVGAIDTSLDAKLEELKANIEFIKHIEGGKWKIVGNQMIFYKDDNGAEVARFDLFDINGKPATINVTERRRA